ncbi:MULTISPECIES: hypothetical protein [unclassified Achromobacter]|uniref:hypothetical protein n=1 Tax=unclassified Achromobacter TaxID=2626865 RepID=UPI000B516902|nr:MULTISPECIES: hypothetical protein [unclassified Achromobacter]OWT68946.1 hypothetical protein CEY04_29635 [Achromobacter sp. HZ28]OWT78491.1 hypothetical protein CEY05_11415 [Achromobacter sp. HZ34]
MRSTLQAFALILAAASLSPALAAEPAGTASFDGKWSYASECNFGHFASLAVTQGKDGAATGQWSDGTRVRGSAGDLRGHLEGKKLFVRFCTDDAENGSTQCPAYEKEDSAYLVREGKKLAWYRKVGAGSNSQFEKYLELQHGDRKSISKDKACPKDEE